MKKYLPLVITGIAVLLALGVMAAYLWQQQTSDQAPATDWTIMGDNELVILHLNVPVTTKTSLLTLTLTEHGDQQLITVQDNGTSLGSITFTELNQTQSLGDYSFRLNSVTNSAVQVVVFSPIAS